MVNRLYQSCTAAVAVYYYSINNIYQQISNQLVPYNGVREELKRKVDAGNGMPECFRTDSKTPYHHENALPWYA